MYKDKHAQISEGLTWVVATIAIIIILLFSLFLTSFVFKDNLLAKNYFSYSIPQKSFLSYLLTKESNGGVIYSKIKADESLTDFNGNLARQVFNKLYKKNYPVAIWLGVDFEGLGIRKNDFFGSKPTSVRGGDISYTFVDYVYNEIPLSKEKWIKLILMNK